MLINQPDKLITHLYGFELSEQAMHDYIYKNVRNPSISSKSYSQLECYECLKMTNKMLDEEIAVALK